jgi:hypothetical protein
VSQVYGVATVGVEWKKKKKKEKKKKKKEEEGYVEWVTKTLTTLLHKSLHRIPLRSLWRPLNVDGGAYATQQNNLSPL